MPPEDRLRKTDYIVTAFRRYLETDDENLISGIPYQELVKALNTYASSRGDRESGWYLAIKRRVDKFDEESRYQRTRRDKWLDRIVSFLLGVAVTVAGGLLVWYITEQVLPKPAP